MSFRLPYSAAIGAVVVLGLLALPVFGEEKPTQATEPPAAVPHGTAKLQEQLEKMLTLLKTVEDTPKVREEVARLFSELDLRKEMSFEEIHRVGHSLREVVSILVKDKHPACKGFFQDFQRSPELPYQRVGPWHTEYYSRGIQGIFAAAIIDCGDQEQKQQLYALLEDADVSMSVKRTIVWSMSHDMTPETTVFLRRLMQLGNDKMIEEARNTLHFMKMREETLDTQI